MKKIISWLAAFAFCLSALPMPAAKAASVPSPWAAEEVEKAISMGFVPAELQGDYQKDITREEFALLAVSFCADQLGYTHELDRFLEDYRTYYQNSDGSRIAAIPEEFSDASPYGSLASALGIVKGRGDGTFDPQSSITRQEAAVMLLRAYTAYAGSPDQPFFKTADYADKTLFPDWAVESIEFMYAWLVMMGDGNSYFHPTAHYTREQSILTFLRLCQSAPNSRAKGGVRPLIPFEEELRRTLSPTDASTSFTVTSRYDNPDNTVLLGSEQSATGPRRTRLWVIYNGYYQGGRKELYDIVAQDLEDTPTISDISFSNDKTTMYFTATVGDQKENYQFSLDAVYAHPQKITAATKLVQLPSVFSAVQVTGFDGSYVYATERDGDKAIYDLQGNRLLSIRDGVILPAGENMLMTQQAAGVTYYTLTGKPINTIPYAAGTIFSGDRAVVQMQPGDLAIIDRQGIVLKKIISKSGTLSDLSLSSDCVILTTGKNKILFNIETGASSSEYLDIQPFSQGRAAVRSDKGWGYLDTGFKLVIPHQYRSATSFSTSFPTAIVEQQGGLFGGIDSWGGNFSVPFEYRYLSAFTPYGYGLGERQIDGVWRPVLMSQTALPIALPGQLSEYRLYGKYAVRHAESSFEVYGPDGTALFPEIKIQGILGAENADRIIVLSGGNYYQYGP